MNSKSTSLDDGRQQKNTGALTGIFKRCWSAFQPWNDGKNNADRVLTSRLRSGILVRSYITAALMAVFFFALVRHVRILQIEKTEFYQKNARVICLRSSIDSAHRGRILDKNGNLFAADQATRDVFAEPKRFADNLPKAAEIIAANLGLDKDKLLAKFQKSAAYGFSVKLSDSIPLEFVGEHNLSKIKALKLKPIFDADGQVTAFKAYFYPSELNEQERKEACDLILEHFDFPKVEFSNKCRKALERCQEIAVMHGVSRDAAAKMLVELRENGIHSGVRFTDSWVRDYPRDCELANMLGFTDNENRGVSGIEKLMDKYLRPVQGKSTRMQDCGGRPIEGSKTIVEEAVDGADVYLTIQEPIQRILEEELAKMWEKNRPDRAYAIMIEPSTGAIMGLAQFPQFNPNDRSTMEDPDICQNHILLQSYDPGSIMKAISLTGVLAEGVATLDTVKDCEKGSWVYNRKRLRDSHRFEDLSLSEVIKHSSNIGTAKFALDLGEEKMYKHLVGFGFGKPTGLGFYPEDDKPVVFRREEAGLFRELHQWDSLTITRVPMGQGMTVPLLQMMQAWSALANNGVIMQPYIVDCVKYANGEVKYSEPHVKAEPVPSTAVRDMVKALVTVTEKGGTGHNAAIPGFKIAGKTGTAQMWIPADKAKGVKGHYAEKQFLASFVGFAPADEPRFLLLVSAENPTQGSHTGAGVSAPVFKQIAIRTLQYLQVSPEEESTAMNNTASNNTALR